MLAAVRAFLALGEQAAREKAAKKKVQVQEALLAELANALPHGAKAGTPRGKERRVRHRQVYILVQLDMKLKIQP